MSHRPSRSPGGPPLPRAVSSVPSWNQHTLHFALKAVEVLMSNGGFLPDTKAQFALRMDWIVRTTNGVDKPDVRMVENICNLTRDQDEWDVARDALGGFVVSYAPSTGGMTLIDPDGDLPLHHLTHILLGDMQRQKTSRTINKRRLPTWRAAGENAATSGDPDLARLFWQAENEIKQTGFVSDTIMGQIFQAAGARGLLSTRS